MKNVLYAHSIVNCYFYVYLLLTFWLNLCIMHIVFQYWNSHTTTATVTNTDNTITKKHLTRHCRWYSNWCRQFINKEKKKRKKREKKTGKIADFQLRNMRKFLFFRFYLCSAHKIYWFGITRLMSTQTI